MSVMFKILKSPPLVYVRYEGYADLDSTIASAQACTTHPDFHPSLPHFFDFGAVTGYEKAFSKFFAMQAELSEVYLGEGAESLVVFYAPDGPAREMAELSRKSWDGVSGVVMRILTERDQALSILGVTAEAIENGDVVKTG